MRSTYRPSERWWEKHQTMGPEADFLGMITDLSCALLTGIVSICPRHRIIESIAALCKDALEANYLRPSAAKSLLGKLMFASMGMYQKLGRAPARPLIQRACMDAAPWTLSFTLEGPSSTSCSSLIAALIGASTYFHAGAPLLLLRLTRRRILIGRLQQVPLLFYQAVPLTPPFASYHLTS